MTTPSQEIVSAAWFRRQVSGVRPLSVDRDAWERQPFESRQAYAAFVVYVEMGPHTRSTAKVAKQVGKSKRLMERWSRRWQWVVRADANDDDENRRVDAELRRERIDAHKRWRGTGLAFQTIAIKRALGVRQKDSTEWDVPPIDPRHFDAQEIKMFLELGQKLEAAGLGEPQDQVQIQASLAAAITYDEHITIETILQRPEATATAARLLEQILQPHSPGAPGTGGMGEPSKP